MTTAASEQSQSQNAGKPRQTAKLASGYILVETARLVISKNTKITPQYQAK